MILVIRYFAVYLISSLIMYASSGSPSDVLLTMPITVDGAMKDLQLLKGESYEDAATSFVRTNGLLANDDTDRVRQVIDQLSGLLKDKMESMQEAAPADIKQPTESRPTVQLTIPITIDQYTGDITKYESETSEAAVERFLYGTGFTMEVMREVYPQLVGLVNQKVLDLQPPRKELFALQLTIDGKTAIARHFEGGDPMKEGKETLLSIGIKDDGVISQIAPQIANEIIKRIAPDMQARTQSNVMRKELLSFPLTMNDKSVTMKIYEGETAHDTAANFLQVNGITDSAIVDQYLPQLIQIIESKLAGLNANNPESAAPPTRTPAVVLPVQLGDGKVANFEYFANDSIEETVTAFLKNLGVQFESQDQFVANVQRISELVRKQLTSELPKENSKLTGDNKPLFTIPITLGGKIFDLHYYKGQQPSSVANSFCVEKHELLRQELGKDFNDNQIQQCQVVLVDEMNKILTTPQGGETPTDIDKVKENDSDTKGDLLFTLDIDIGEQVSKQLPYHLNDNPTVVAQTFCELYDVDMANVPAIVNAIENQLRAIS